MSVEEQRTSQIPIFTLKEFEPSRARLQEDQVIDRIGWLKDWSVLTAEHDIH